MFIAVTAGVVVGNIILTVLWGVVGTMAVGAFVNALDFDFGGTPGSSVTSGREYRQQRQEERNQSPGIPQSAARPSIEQSLRDQRQNTPTGRKLYVQCRTWRIQYNSSPSDARRAGRDRACNAYRAYIESGRAP